MSKREKAIYKRAYKKAVKETLGSIAGIIAYSILFVAFLVKRTAAFNALTIMGPMIYFSIAMVIYQIGSERFVEKYLLKYEFSTQLSGVISWSGEYVQICTVLGVVLLITSFAAGYAAFTKLEID